MNRETESPTFAQLVDWIDGKLDTPDARRMEARVATAISAGDRALADTVAWIRAFRARTAHTVLMPPPDAVRASVLRMFGGRHQAQNPSMVQRILAGLARATGPGMAVAGARGASLQARRRQLVFECDAADIVLNTEQTDGRYTLSGQVLPRSTLQVAGMVAQLLRLNEATAGDESEVSLTRADDFGEFAFENVAPGRYAIILVADALEIRVEPGDLS